MRQPGDAWPSLARSSVFIMEDGRVVLATGNRVRLTQLASVSVNADGDGEFALNGADGTWQLSDTIRLGAAWAESTGDFWGVRDVRGETAPNWSAFAGRYGASPDGTGVEIGRSGSIRGTIAGCIVSGQAGSDMAVSLTLTSCSQAGSYMAVLDIPANDNELPSLLIAGQGTGWRLAQ